ncbi:hypothetical protein [Streptomyces sp. HB132]|uniref:hypothetical protein n=1 Tax=Streptomyces sp. HB132 TaxID=767388 RepID=UPI001961998F|nr:hypothetical protein [Streptomyces sp. HB132]MBM7440696.1 hypothetical protein [Streptomyces sp. HB132]
MASINGTATDAGTPGVRGDSEQWNGVLGESRAPGQAGVAGVNSQLGNGIYGRSTGTGVWGHGEAGVDAVGVTGVSDHNDGVRGWSSETGKSGIAGTHTGQGGHGVWGVADKGRGVVGLSKTSTGVYGRSEADEGVRGESLNSNHGGVVGVSFSVGGHGVYGTCDDGTGVVATVKKGTGLYAHADNGRAALLDGHVEVNGKLNVAGTDVLDTLHQMAGLQQAVSGLQQQISGMQQQLTALQSKHTTDVEGIATSLITLAQRVSALGG